MKELVMARPHQGNMVRRQVVHTVIHCDVRFAFVDRHQLVVWLNARAACAAGRIGDVAKGHQIGPA
jgi:hypothetical protein